MAIESWQEQIYESRLPGAGYRWSPRGPGPAQTFAATLARVRTISHAGSSRCFLACLAARAQDREGGGKEIVFNHPGGEICLENDLGVMDGARALLRTSLSASSDIVFHEATLLDEISEL